MEWIGKIFEFLKLPIRIIALFTFISGLLLFLPEQLISTLKLSEFIKSYGKYLGIAFLISVSLLIFTIIPAIFKWIKNKILNKRNNAKFLQKIEKTLLELSYPEKCLLREFIIQRKHVIEAPIENPEVISLLDKSILQYASENVRSFIHGNYCYFKINDKAKNYFTNSTYGLSDQKPTESDMGKMKRERPDFLINLKHINDLINGKFF